MTWHFYISWSSSNKKMLSNQPWGGPYRTALLISLASGVNLVTVSIFVSNIASVLVAFLLPAVFPLSLPLCSIFSLPSTLNVALFFSLFRPLHLSVFFAVSRHFSPSYRVTWKSLWACFPACWRSKYAALVILHQIVSQPTVVRTTILACYLLWMSKTGKILS